MGYGIKVSQAGFDVLTCDPKDLVFGSDYFVNKVLMTGTVDINCNDDANPNFPRYLGTAEITHSLGYVPIFLCYGEMDISAITADESETELRTVKQNFIGLIPFEAVNVFDCASDTTKLTIKMYQNVSGVYTVRYYIFYDNGVTL